MTMAQFLPEFDFSLEMFNMRRMLILKDHRNYVQIGRKIHHRYYNTISAHFTSSIRPIMDFATPEHVIIGDDVDAGSNQADFNWRTQNGEWLTLGQTMALAGDYYGIPESPIVAIDHGNDCSCGRSRFMAAYQTLDLAPKEDLEKLVTMMNSGKNYGDQEWDEATGGYWISGIPFRWGRMLKLAETNYDHFTPQAKEAYLIGHQLAREKAREAGNSTHGNSQKLAMLSKAYSLDAFACHFLTDSFSSGHIRTARVELGKFGLQGHRLSKYMHDEDSKFGLRVKNADGNKWISFGDDMLLKYCSKANFDMVKKAVQLSVDEVRDAYHNPTRYLGRSLVPDLIPFVDREENNNSPLFQVKYGKVLKRSNVDDLQDKRTIDNWWLMTTVLQLAKYSPDNSAIPTCT